MNSLNDNIFEKYKDETKSKWENTQAYKEHTEKTKHYSKEKWNELAESMDGIFAQFAICMKNGEALDSSAVQNLVKKLQEHICQSYYNCTTEIIAGLGQMYVLDERFKNNIDKHANGTALYVSQAIEVFANK